MKMQINNRFLRISLLFSIIIHSYSMGCPNLRMGTHRKIPDIIKGGIVSPYYAPNKDASMYTPYQQKTDYFYINFQGGHLTNSSIEIVKKSNDLDIAYRFMEESKGQYTLEVIYMCHSLFQEYMEISLKMLVPGCGPYEIQWKKTCKLLLLPQFTLQVEAFEKGRVSPLIREGKFVFQLPNKTIAQSNSPANGYEVKDDTLILRVSSFLGEILKKHIVSGSKTLKDALTLEKKLLNFSIQKPEVLYDKNALTVSITGSLMNDPHVSNDPKFLNIKMECKGKQDVLVEFELNISQNSSYSLFFNRLCSGKSKDQQAGTPLIHPITKPPVKQQLSSPTKPKIVKEAQQQTPNKPDGPPNLIILPHIEQQQAEGPAKQKPLPKVLRVPVEPQPHIMVPGQTEPQAHSHRSKGIIMNLFEDILEIVLYCVAFLFFIIVLFMAVLIYQSKSPEFSNHLMKVASSPEDSDLAFTERNNKISYGTIL